MLHLRQAHQLQSAIATVAPLRDGVADVSDDDDRALAADAGATALIRLHDQNSGLSTYPVTVCLTCSVRPRAEPCAYEGAVCSSENVHARIRACGNAGACRRFWEAHGRGEAQTVFRADGQTRTTSLPGANVAEEIKLCSSCTAPILQWANSRSVDADVHCRAMPLNCASRSVQLTSGYELPRHASLPESVRGSNELLLVQSHGLALLLIGCQHRCAKTAADALAWPC
eukprot:6183374-Pleurochrysis_carterae.AAC.1